MRGELFEPLFTQFASTCPNRALRFIAEDDVVVVECRGKVKTVRGDNHNNTHCHVCRSEGGLLRELTEYMDTALRERVLAPPEGVSRRVDRRQ